MLPAEMLERIFRKDQMAAVQVCRGWREPQTPILWPSLLAVNQNNLNVIMELLLYIRRLQIMEALVVRSVSEDLLVAVANTRRT